MHSIHDEHENTVYVELMDRPIANTVVAVPGRVLLDYDTEGNLVGVEVLGTPEPSSEREIVRHASGLGLTVV